MNLKAKCRVYTWFDILKQEWVYDFYHEGATLPKHSLRLSKEVVDRRPDLAEQKIKEAEETWLG